MTVHRATTDYSADIANVHLGGWFLLKANLCRMHITLILCKYYLIDPVPIYVIISCNEIPFCRCRLEAVYFNGCLWILFYFTIANH